jgi:hypothetical protein
VGRLLVIVYEAAALTQHIGLSHSWQVLRTRGPNKFAYFTAR